jgi:hypothetical protein
VLQGTTVKDDPQLLEWGHLFSSEVGVYVCRSILALALPE